MLILNLLMAAGQGGQMLAVGQNGIVAIPKFFRVGLSAAQQVTVAGLEPSNSQGLVAWSEDGLTLANQDSNGKYVYTREGFQFTPKADDLTGMLGSLALGMSADGGFIATGGASTSPYIAIHKKGVDGEYDKLASPMATPPTGRIQGCSFTPDGSYLAVAHNTSPYISVYSISGDTFTKVSNPSSLPTDNGQSAKWSPGGTYLAVMFSDSPFLYVYKRSGSSLTKLANPAGTTTKTDARDAAFSADGTFLAASFGSNEVVVWQRTSDTFAKVADITDAPQFVECCSWSSDGNFLALGGSGGDVLAVYRRNGTTFTKINLIASETISAILSIGFFPPAVPGSG